MKNNFAFTCVLLLLVSEVSYIHSGVDVLVFFSAMYYNAFQVTNINQLFKFKKSHSYYRIHCILEWGLALHEKTSVQHSFIA